MSAVARVLENLIRSSGWVTFSREVIVKTSFLPLELPSRDLLAERMWFLSNNTFRSYYVSVGKILGFERMFL